MAYVNIELSPVAFSFYSYQQKHNGNKRICDLMKKAILLVIDKKSAISAEKPCSEGVIVRIPNCSFGESKFDFRSGVYVSKTKAKWLSDLFEQMFYERLKCHVELTISSDNKNRVDQTVISFLKQYGISEDDLKLDSVLKKLRRDKVYKNVNKRMKTKLT